MEPVDCYLRLIEPLKDEVKLVSRDLKRSAGKDAEVQLLMTIPGVGYYVALLGEVGDRGHKPLQQRGPPRKLRGSGAEYP